MCSYEAQGLFINICSLYWSRLGDLPERMAVNMLCKGYANALQELCNEQILHIQDGMIRIKFLDEQLDEFASISNERSKAAKKRWSKQPEKQEHNANALHLHSKSNAIREEKRRVEKIREEESISADAQQPFFENPLEDESQPKPPQKEKEKSSAKKEKRFGKAEFREALITYGADPIHVDDWLAVRSAKRAVFTETALSGFLNECEKHNFFVPDAVRICAENSWTGFKVDWLKNKTASRNDNQSVSKLENNVNALRSILIPE